MIGPATAKLPKFARVTHSLIDDNSRTECPFAIHFCFCNQGVKALHLIPSEAFQDVQINWWIFRLLRGQTGVLAKKYLPWIWDGDFYLVIIGSLLLLLYAVT